MVYSYPNTKTAAKSNYLAKSTSPLRNSLCPTTKGEKSLSQLAKDIDDIVRRLDEVEGAITDLQDYVEDMEGT